MMLPDYNYQSNRGPVDGMEVYCRLEGLDPVYIRSMQKKVRVAGRTAKEKSAKAAGVIRRFLGKLTGSSSIHQQNGVSNC